MKSISEYFNEDEDRSARVSVQDGIPVVEFFRYNKLVETRSFPDNTLEYAENAAENYAMGVLKL